MELLRALLLVSNEGRLDILVKDCVYLVEVTEEESNLFGLVCFDTDQAAGERYELEVALVDTVGKARFKLVPGCPS